jgi:hypothetical protein
MMAWPLSSASDTGVMTRALPIAPATFSSLRLLRLDVVNPIRPGRRIVGQNHSNSRLALAFLAPKLVQAAVEGRLPCGIGVTNISLDEGDLRA